MYDNLTRTNLEFAHRESEKQIAKLEKENAELREQHYADCKIVYKISGEIRQFDKAKELLYRVVDTPMYHQVGGEVFESEEHKELIAEVERFLKEIEHD